MNISSSTPIASPYYDQIPQAPATTVSSGTPDLVTFSGADASEQSVLNGATLSKTLGLTMLALVCGATGVMAAEAPPPPTSVSQTATQAASASTQSSTPTSTQKQQPTTDLRAEQVGGNTHWTLSHQVPVSPKYDSPVIVISTHTQDLGITNPAQAQNNRVQVGIGIKF